VVATASERDTFLAAEQDAWRGWELLVRAVRPSHADEVVSGRSVRQHVAHMADWHRWGAERLADRIEGRAQTTYPDWHAFEDAFNRESDARSRGRPWEAVLEDGAAAYAAFRARVEQLDDAQLASEKGLVAACGSRHYAEYQDALLGLLDRVPPQALFETPRLRLRSLRPADAAAIFEMFSDPEVMRFIPPSPNPLTVDRVRRGILRRAAIERESGLTLWLVERKDTGETIGQSGFALVEGSGPDVEIAYHYAKRAWGQGYATEAATACLERGFGELGLERVIAICYPENTASWRVMEKAGMTFDGEGDYYGIRMKRYVAARGTWRRPGS
jgi:[ribosomal protein S5]-alanine N-acetyltransferase